MTTKRFIAVAHRRDLAVHVWTIDDPAQMRELLHKGVDGIMTNTPKVLAEVAADEGVDQAVAPVAAATEPRPVSVPPAATEGA